MADKQFKRPYSILNTSKPIDRKKSYFETNSIYHRFLCKRYMKWDELNISSEFGTLKTGTTKDLEYPCFISTPIFSNNITKCRLYMSIRYSEWGGHGTLYFYEKIDGKWELVRSVVQVMGH